MARLLFFAAIREAAGSRSAEVDASTIAHHALSASPFQRKLDQFATGSAVRTSTRVPVKVEPVVPVSSTVRYDPIIGGEPATMTVLKSRDRARLQDFARFRRSFELGMRERDHGVPIAQTAQETR